MKRLDGLAGFGIIMRRAWKGLALENEHEIGNIQC